MMSVSAFEVITISGMIDITKYIVSCVVYDMNSYRVGRMRQIYQRVNSKLFTCTDCPDYFKSFQIFVFGFP